MKILKYGILLLSLSSFADTKIDTFQKVIKSDCKDGKVSNLLVKKSLIELVRGFECEGKFTSLIISKCTEIDCQRMTDIFRQIQQAKPGSVVGDD